MPLLAGVAPVDLRHHRRRKPLERRRHPGAGFGWVREPRRLIERAAVDADQRVGEPLQEGGEELGPASAAPDVQHAHCSHLAGEIAGCQAHDPDEPRGGTVAGHLHEQRRRVAPGLESGALVQHLEPVEPELLARP